MPKSDFDLQAAEISIGPHCSGGWQQMGFGDWGEAVETKMDG